MEKNVAGDSWSHTARALGVSACLMGALLMVAGEGILGESYSGVAAVTGIIGIALIAYAKRIATQSK